MRVKVRSIKRICIVIGIISLFLCVFIFIRNSIAKSKAIDFINENLYFKAYVVGGASQEQIDTTKTQLNKYNKIDGFEYDESAGVFTIRVKINNIADVSENYLYSIENGLKKIEYIERVESNSEKILKYYGIYGYKDFIEELQNS